MLPCNVEAFSVKQRVSALLYERSRYCVSPRCELFSKSQVPQRLRTQVFKMPQKWVITGIKGILR